MKKRDLIKLPRLRFYGSFVISLFISWLYIYPHGLNNLSILLFVGITSQIALFSKSLYKALKIGILHKYVNVGSSLVISILFTWIGSLFMFTFVSEWSELACFVYISWLISFYLLGNLWVVTLHHKEVDLMLPNVLPKNVHVVLDNGVIVEIEAKNVVSGDRIKVYSNEVIPFDGEIIVGNTFVDESLISGLALYATKQKGDTIIAGTTNKGGAIVFEVRLSGTRSKYDNLMEKVKNILEKDHFVEDNYETISPFFIGFVASILLLLLLFWLFINLQTPLFFGLFFFVSVVIVSCPIFLKLSSPAILFYASHILRRLGFIVKNYSSILNVSKVDAIVLDLKCWNRENKNCMRVAWNESEGNQTLYLSLIADICKKGKQYYSQVLADSIESDLLSTGVKYKSEYSSEGGEIISLNGDTYLLGTRQFLISHNIALPKSMGKTDLEVYWIVNNRVSAIFYLPESLISEEEKWISMVRSYGIEFYLMSADSENHTKKLAEQLSIISYIYDADADKKLEFVKNLQTQGKKVLVIGASISDLLALAQSDVSVVFSDSSNVSLAITDIVLNSSKLGLLSKLILLSKQVEKRIKRGTFICYLIPILSMLFVSGILYWFFQIVVLGEIALSLLVIEVVLLLINTLNLKGGSKHL